MLLRAVRERYGDPKRWLLRTNVETGASLGAKCIILPGIRIGTYAMVAAGAVVTKDVKAHALVVGTPAKQTAWVCRCGARLKEVPGSGWSCPQCAEVFDRVGG